MFALIFSPFEAVHSVMTKFSAYLSMTLTLTESSLQSSAAVPRTLEKIMIGIKWNLHNRTWNTADRTLTYIKFSGEGFGFTILLSS